MGEKRVIRYEVRGDGFVSEIHARRELAWTRCWKIRIHFPSARVVRIVAKPRESAADAYERGRREERADVVAYLGVERMRFIHADNILQGCHLGAPKKGGA